MRKFLSALFRRNDDLATRSLNEYTVGTLRDPGGWAQLFGTDGGHLSPERALTIPAVWRAVELISRSFATLPAKPYERLPGGGKVELTDDPLWDLVHDDANPELSAVEFRERVMVSALLRGNGIAEIERDLGGRPLAMWPIATNRVTPVRLDGALWYRVALASGQFAFLSPDDTFHLPGLVLEGIWGCSVIEVARRNLTLSIGQEEYAQAFYANGAQTGGILSVPAATKLLPEVEAELRKQFNERHQGARAAHQVGLLKGGITYSTRDQMSQSDAQWLEGRNFSVFDVARWFGLRPSYLMAQDAVNYASQEADQNQFISETLRPWSVKWETEMRRKLIDPPRRRRVFIEFNLDAHVRGNIKEQYDAFHIGRLGGWLSVNDIRARINLNPIAGGDVYLQPLGTIDQARATEFLFAGRSADPTRAAEPADATSDTATRSARLAGWTALIGTHRRMGRVFTDRLAKTEPATRAAFVLEYRGKYDAAMRPLCDVLAPLEGKPSADLLETFWTELQQ